MSRWLDFVKKINSGSLYKNSRKFVKDWNFGNFEIPGLENFFKDQNGFLTGAKCRSRPIFSNGGPRFPKNKTKKLKKGARLTFDRCKMEISAYIFKWKASFA